MEIDKHTRVNIKRNIIRNILIYRKLYKNKIKHYLYNNKYMILFKIKMFRDVELFLSYKIIPLEQYKHNYKYDYNIYKLFWSISVNKKNEYIFIPR